MSTTLSNLLRDLAPPALLRLYRNTFGRTYGFHGDFGSWQQARAVSSGYDSRVILEKARAALRQVKNGTAAYERDTVLFAETAYDWPILSGLLRVAGLQGNRLRVLDFGGSLGSLYYQHRSFLTGLTELSWYVVEQPQFVSCGRAEFQDRHLKFRPDLESCLAGPGVDVALLVSVLPYLKSPFKILGEIMSAGIPHLIIDRVPLLHTGDRDRLTIQKVPPRIYPASYPAWFFNRRKFIDFIQKGYRIHARYPCAIDSGIAATFEGFILEKI